MKSKYILPVILFAIINVSFSRLSPKDEPNELIERVYLQTDKPLYFPGETVWFKAYAVLNNNRITNISDVLYVDLVSPKGDVVKTLELRIAEGAAYGNFDILPDMVGGMYKVQAYTRWMKNFGLSIVFKRKIMVQKVVKPKLLLKLEFEKEAYGKNSEVTAEFEAKNLKNEALSDNEMEFIVNIEGETFNSGKFTTDLNGKAKLKFTLPEDLESSDVILNVLVPHKGSMESISRSVPVILDNIDLQFLPEGGYLLSGVKNTLAFKALNEYGKPADFSAIIVDENGIRVNSIESFHDGMGKFEFLPEKDTKYFAKITEPFKSELLYELPKAKNEGYVLSLVKNNDTEIIFNVYSAKAEKVILKAQNAAQKLMNEKLFLSKGWNEISLSAKDFPLGIVEFTLFNSKNKPQVERLVFAGKGNELNISVKTNKEKYAPREKVEVEITTTDKNGTPLPSSLSLSVVDDKIISLADDKQDNILSYLLVSSFLKGEIYEPNFYFNPKEEKAEAAIDLLMLTNGWRSYFVENTIFPATAQYKPEQISIETRMVTDSDNKPVEATVLVFEQSKGRKLVKIQTDETGIFSFKKEPNKNYIAVAYNNKNEQLYIKKEIIKPVKTKPDSTSVPTKTEVPDKTDDPKNEKNKETPENKIKSKPEETKDKKPKKVKVSSRPVKQKVVKNEFTTNSTYKMESENVSLDEVVVVGYGASRKSNLTASVVSISAEELMAVDIKTALPGKVAGVEILTGNSGSGSNVMIRGTRSISANSEPLYIIDGMPVTNAQSREIFNSLSADNVSSINVLKGNAAAAIYGSRGANGVIVIATKSGNYMHRAKTINLKKSKKLAFHYFYYYRDRRFSTNKQFYIPGYDSKEPVSVRTDFRNTIYWNPVIQTNDEGKAKFHFYNSDAVTTYKITAEGISYNGLPGRVEKAYSIIKPLSIDVKIPAYLTLGDTLDLPLIVSNNTDTSIVASISVNLPPELKLIDEIPDSVQISAQSGTTKTLKIIPVKEIKTEEILLGAKSNIGEDLFTQEISIVSPLFPKRLSFSDSKSRQFEFNLNDQIEPNSLKADFTVYLDIIGDVMNGIESIMREPYGCFEQVSSSAYPNVMVMKYLRESGKLTPKIQRKAMRFIESGYRKLAAYETSQGGFEWYGKTPPHEVLTAYGILQFTEMKEVYFGVNEKMIKRTVKWLLSRRNGLGGFKQNRGRYGFSGSPQNVSNAYIVYALAESGVEVDIEKEYQHAFNEAFAEKDLYRLALMANAAYSLKKFDDYDKIINILKHETNWKNPEKIKADATITYSYGNSLQVETMSFMALALMKPGDNTAYAEQCINFILKNRQYGRFGNTQATAMALKALIEYTRLRKNDYLKQVGNEVTVKVNGHSRTAELQEDEKGLIQISGIEEFLTSGKQNIEVSFSNSDISIPYSIDLAWKTNLPATAEKCNVDFSTEIKNHSVRLGETVRMKVEVQNKKNTGIPMTLAIVGIPSGLSVQSKQLEELAEKNKFAYYELKENYVVFYWRELGPRESKIVNLDLKTELKGKYKAAASSAYLYYADEDKNWLEGAEVEVW